MLFASFLFLQSLSDNPSVPTINGTQSGDCHIIEPKGRTKKTNICELSIELAFVLLTTMIQLI